MVCAVWCRKRRRESVLLQPALARRPERLGQDRAPVPPRVLDEHPAHFLHVPCLSGDIRDPAGLGGETPYRVRQ